MQKQERKKLEAETRKRTSENADRISRLLTFGMTFELLAIALNLANIWKYWGNRNFMYVTGFLVVLLILIFIYTIRIYQGFKKIGKKSRGLATILEGYVNFYQRAFYPWIALYSLSAVLLIYAFNMQSMDFRPNMNFRFFEPFLIIYFGAFLLLFLVTRLMFGRYLKMFRTYQRDLELRQLTSEKELEGSFGRFRMAIMGGLLLLLAVLVAYYIIKFHPFG